MLAAVLVLTFAASMAGGLVPAAEGLIERLGLERVLSFRSGILVAVALADALPEAWNHNPPAAVLAAVGAVGLGWSLHKGHAEEHSGHELTHPHIPEDVEAQIPATLAALFAHSLIDGLNLGAIAHIGGGTLLAIGAATTLHKLADGFTLTSLFARSVRPRGPVLALLIAASLMTPLGAVLGQEGHVVLGPVVTGLILGFAGGSFLYVGASQILPRLGRGRGAGSAAAFVAGAAAMILLSLLSD